MTLNDTIGLILLTLLAIGIVAGYIWFFGSVMKQDQAEYPRAKKPTKADIIKRNDLNHLLDVD